MLVLPGGNAKKKYDYKITKKFFRKSPAPTKDDSEPQLKFVCQALTFGNALLATAFKILC